MNRRKPRAGARTSQSIGGVESPDALYEAGLAHMRAERYLDAQLCCRQALAVDPDHADTLHLMGQLSLHAKQYDLAVEWLSRAIRREPKPAYLANLGTALLNQGRREEALKAFDKAVQLQPDDADLWTKLGNTLVEAERPADATLSFQQALKLNPRHWDAANKAALLFLQSGRFEEALVCCNLCDELQPDGSLTLSMRALTLYNLRRFEEALADNRRAHALDSTNADICNNTGNVLRSLGRDEEALAWFDQAVELRPSFATAVANKAVSLAELRRFDEAFAAYYRARAIDPNDALAEWNLALLQLQTGNFRDGWAGREARWKIPSLSVGYYPELSGPAWSGAEPIAGKTILLCADEGLGDSIQFARYVPIVAARGARVILVVHDALCSLLAGLAGVSECLPKSAATLPAFDFHCPLSRLPLVFGTRLDTIPAEKSYLPPPAADRVQGWQERLGPHDRLRVGLVWSGNPKHNNDRNRSIPLRELARILDVDATFVSLQKAPKPDDRAALLERSEIVDLTADLTDFAETAALVSCLDLVITVDTSVAHLAGALGCPTWILLPYYAPDFRWLLDRDDSPWYPSVRLFRQNQSRDYADVLERVRAELRARVIAFRPEQRHLSAPTQGSVALYEAGLAHIQAGRYLDAQLCCQRALAADPAHADTLHLLGLLSLHAKQYDHAVEWIARAIRQDPKPEYLASLGTTLQQQGRREEALKAFDKAVQRKPDDAELWKCMGSILLELARFDHALLSFQQALKLNPRHQDAAYKSGILLNHFGRFEEALAHFNLCDEILPNHAPALEGRVRALYYLNRFEEALADSRRVYALDPGNADNCNTIGAALRSLGRYEEALGWLDRALEVRPNLVEALENKIISLAQLHRFDDAFALYERMKALKLNNTRTDWNVSVYHRLTGNFEAGWVGHEARLKLPSATYPKFPQPMWLGEENIEGKTILICADEGLGDTIHFVRYVPMLTERGARVVLAVQNPLHQLLSALPGVSQCIPTSALNALPAFEMHCPISSLPLAFGTRLDTIPSATSYLPSPPTSRAQAWEDRLGPHAKLRVGLVWSGSSTHTNDHNRSIPLQALSRLLDADAAFVSLQKDPRPNDTAVLRDRSDIVDLTADLTDFSETAALVSCLDLVITVDTSVAHLAGALGCPTWILLPYTPDYRWLLDRDDSPWYPSVRLFRQNETREYESVLDRVRDELRARIVAFRPEEQLISPATQAVAP